MLSEFITKEDFSITASSNTFAARWTPISLKDQHHQLMLWWIVLMVRLWHCLCHCLCFYLNEQPWCQPLPRRPLSLYFSFSWPLLSLGIWWNLMSAFSRKAFVFVFIFSWSLYFFLPDVSLLWECRPPRHVLLTQKLHKSLRRQNFELGRFEKKSQSWN